MYKNDYIITFVSHYLPAEMVISMSINSFDAIGALIRRLGSVPEVHKGTDDDGGIVLENIFTAKTKSCKSDN